MALVAVQFALAFRPYHGVLHWGLTLIPLVLAVALASRRIEIPVPRWLEYLGDISFSLYLLHTIVLGVVFSLVREHAQSWLVTRVAVVAAILVAIAVAALSHRYVERGLCDWLRRVAFERFGFLRDRGVQRSVLAGATTSSRSA
jgi:peptidoglycan/LPS O-acetylase OafA/YrhL